MTPKYRAPGLLSWLHRSMAGSYQFGFASRALEEADEALWSNYRLRLKDRGRSVLIALWADAVNWLTGLGVSLQLVNEHSLYVFDGHELVSLPFLLPRVEARDLRLQLTNLIVRLRKLSLRINRVGLSVKYCALQLTCLLPNDIAVVRRNDRLHQVACKSEAIECRGNGCWVYQDTSPWPVTFVVQHIAAFAAKWSVLTGAG